MRHITTEDFNNQYESLPIAIQKKYKKQLGYLLKNFRHPSLQTKKYGGSDDIFQARVDQSYRFYFRIINDCYVIFKIIQHFK